jgi:SAM-dependent methyltransferase
MMHDLEKVTLYRVLSLMEAQGQDVAVFGTGGFARLVVAQIRAWDFPDPVALLDQEQAGTTILSLPVLHPDAFRGKAKPQVVLGTREFVLQMRRRLADSWGPGHWGFDLTREPSPRSPSMPVLDKSETAKARKVLGPYCMGDGVDVGFGGDPVVPRAICVDLNKPYAYYSEAPQQLQGDGARLHWFADNSLDYVYSSHLLEDFPHPLEVLKEWVRVVKIGGLVVLFLPDEQRYRAFCRDQGLPPNPHHTHEHFSLPWLLSQLVFFPNLQVVHAHQREDYNFELVLKKG